MSRPYPTLPPQRQLQKRCEIPIPNSIKKSVVTFNRREYWGWGANITERNCVPQDTIIEKPPPPPAQYVYTFAGNGNAGDDNGPGIIATLAFPEGVTVDTNNNVYVSDTANNKIRKVTPIGIVSTIAGNGYRGNVDSADPMFATFNNPTGIAIDSIGNIYVSDSGNNKIRKINPSGEVTTFAGSGTAGFTNGTGTGASFSFPTDINIDLSDNLYIADTQNHAIRICTSLGIVSTIAGDGYKGYIDGNSSNAEFSYPSSAISISGNVYIADTGNDCIRVIKNNVVSTLALTPSPGGLAYDLSTLVVTSQTENIIVRVSLAGKTELFAGQITAGLSDGITLSASFAFPTKIAYNNNFYYVSDMLNNAIRRISYNTNPTNYVLKTTDTSPFIIPNNSGGIMTYSLMGGGGGGDISSGFGGGGGGGSAFVTNTISGANAGLPLQFSVGKKGFRGTFFPYLAPNDGGDTFIIVPNDGTIYSYGGHAATSVSGGLSLSGGYGGGGGVPSGIGGGGTISSGKNGGLTIGGNGGGDPDSGKGGSGGGGGGGHGGGNGLVGSCNATFYGGGGGGAISSSVNSGEGGNGIIVLTLY